MLSRSTRFLSMAFVILMVLTGVAPLDADATQKAISGQEIQIVENKGKITVTKNPEKGVARVDPSGTGANQTFRLFYKAGDVQQASSDSLEYTVGNDKTPEKVTIQIDTALKTLAPETYEQGGRAIFLLFVLAVVLESALAVLFNWRPFVETFNARAVRPLVSFVFAYAVVSKYGLDLVTSLINASTKAILPPQDSGMIITAMVLAGGSAGVNNLLVALGYREKKTPETVAPKPPPDKAWIAVRIVKKGDNEPIAVLIGTPDAAGTPPAVGVIRGVSRRGLRFFLSDRGRFPGYGGHAVPAGSQVKVQLLQKTTSVGDWGPYTVAGGAVIDLDFRVNGQSTGSQTQT